MKKTCIFLALALLAAACNKAQNVAEAPLSSEDANGAIHLTITPEDGPLSKAGTAYSEQLGYETVIKRVQIFVFGPDGKIVSYYVNEPSQTPSLDVTMTTTPGPKTVWAVVNGPDLKSVATLTELQSSAVDLKENGTTEAVGFIMAGSNSCTVSGSAPVECDINVSRLVSRIAVTSIKNRLPVAYGVVKLRSVYLSNVVGNQNVAGTAAPATWYNQDGRVDETTRSASHIINSSSTLKASCPDLTFKNMDVNVDINGSYVPTRCAMYTYPNSNLTAPDGFSSPFTPKCCVLTIETQINGDIQYYPIALNKNALERNTSYTVEVTLKGPGSNDPNKPAERGSLEVSLHVQPWSATIVYDEVI